MHPQHQDYQLAGLAALATMVGHSRGKKQLILPSTTPARQQVVTRVRVGRNEPCPCGSGKKFKKCHGSVQSVHQRPESLQPKEKPIIAGAVIDEVATDVTAPTAKQATARAMLAAKIPERTVWAYLETGIFVTTQNRSYQSEETLAAWDAALEAYDKASPEDRCILEVPA